MDHLSTRVGEMSNRSSSSSFLSPAMPVLVWECLACHHIAPYHPSTPALVTSPFSSQGVGFARTCCGTSGGTGGNNSAEPLMDGERVSGSRKQQQQQQQTTSGPILPSEEDEEAEELYKELEQMWLPRRQQQQYQHQQLLAKLARDGTVLGKREMRLCTTCDNLRCAEVKEVHAEVMEGAAASSATAASVPLLTSQRSSSRYYDERITLRENDDSRRCAWQTPDVERRDAFSLPCSSSSPPSQHSNEQQDEEGRKYNARGKGEAGSTSHRRRRGGVRSAHTVVAEGLARLIVSSRHIAMRVLSYNPLAPRLPSPVHSYDATEGEDGEREKRGWHGVAREHAKEKEQQCSSSDVKRANACGSSFDGCSWSATEDTAHNPSFSSSSSVESVGARVRNGDDREEVVVSRNRTALVTPPRQSQQQQPWVEATSTLDEHFTTQGSSEAILQASGSTGAAAQLVAGGPTAQQQRSGLCQYLGQQQVEATKSKWNMYSVKDTVLRLVLPSLCAPFTCASANAAAVGTTASTIPAVSPLRAHDSPGRSGGGGVRQNYVGEVRQAFSELNDVQLRVAKLRLQCALDELLQEEITREAAQGVEF